MGNSVSFTAAERQRETHTHTQRERERDRVRESSYEREERHTERDSS
jgi:hypothetical protein